MTANGNQRPYAETGLKSAISGLFRDVSRP
jgi:hypothetical protein